MNSDNVIGTADESRGWIGRFSTISWKAVIAGVVLATASQVLLTILGAAIGLSAVEPRFVSGELSTAMDTAEGMMMGAGVWWILTGIISLAVGGATAAHYSSSMRAVDGAVHGALAWATMLLLCGFMAGTDAAGLLAGSVGFAGMSMNKSASMAAPRTAEPTISMRNDQSPDGARETRPAREARNPDGTPMNEVQIREAVEKARGIAAKTAWWTFLSLTAGLGAAIVGGSLCAATRATLFARARPIVARA